MKTNTFILFCLVYLCRSIDYSSLLGRLFVLSGVTKFTINRLASKYSVDVNLWEYDHTRLRLHIRMTSLDEYSTNRFVKEIQNSGLASNVWVTCKVGGKDSLYIKQGR